MCRNHLLPLSLVTTALLLLASLLQCYGRMLRPESDAKRLYDDKLRFSGYNKLIRPVGNTSDTLTVRIGLRLTQIIDVVSIYFNLGSSVLGSTPGPDVFASLVTTLVLAASESA